MTRQAETVEQSWNRLLTRLKCGTVRTHASVYQLRDWDDEELETQKDVEVTATAWTHSTAHTLIDARSGMVRMSCFAPEAASPVEVIIHGLAVSASDVADLTRGSAPPAVTNRGRPYGRWWPLFAEEMMVYFWVEGLPDETTPLATTASAILDRMARRGWDTPETKTVLPVLKRVLERLRAEDAN